jgi:menaquinone-specific isochorismate synthase
VEEIEFDLEKRLQDLTDRFPGSIPFLPIAITFRIDPIDVLRWLAGQPQTPRLYWAGRDGHFETSGHGVALSINERVSAAGSESLSEIETILRASEDDPFLRFIGGRRFHPGTSADPLWADFPPVWFGIPRLSVTRTGEDHFITVAVRVVPGATPAAIREEVKAILDSASLTSAFDLETPSLSVISRVDNPDRTGWIENVTRSLNDIEKGTVDKVVLARRTDLHFSGRADPFSLLFRLRERNRNCFAFLFEPRPGKAFVGVTPERLFKIEGDEIISEAISGTTVRETNPDRERSEGVTPLYSEKNLREHQYVIEDIHSRIGTICERIESLGERSTFDLSNVSHIYSRISGRLKKEVSMGDVLTTLHPTPAVGGTPREKALPLMRDLEPFDRGWYAAPVGIIGHRRSEMAVAIRSAIVEGDRASLFAGAGIIAGSTPEAEWQELEQKISHAVLGLSGALR